MTITRTASLVHRKSSKSLAAVWHVFYALRITKQKHPLYWGVFGLLKIVLLVREIDVRWNTMRSSILLMHRKLVALSLRPCQCAENAIKESESSERPAVPIQSPFRRAG